MDWSWMQQLSMTVLPSMICGRMCSRRRRFARAMGLSENEHRIPETIEAIVFLDGQMISGEDALAPGKRADHREQCRARKMEVGDDGIGGAKRETRHDKQRGAPGIWLQRQPTRGDALQRANGSGADGDHA